MRPGTVVLSLIFALAPGLVAAQTMVDETVAIAGGNPLMYGPIRGGLAWDF